MWNGRKVFVVGGPGGGGAGISYRNPTRPLVARRVFYNTSKVRNDGDLKAFPYRIVLIEMTAIFRFTVTKVTMRLTTVYQIDMYLYYYYYYYYHYIVREREREINVLLRANKTRVRQLHEISIFFFPRLAFLSIASPILSSPHHQFTI